MQWTRLPDGEVPPAFVEHTTRLSSLEPTQVTTEVRSPAAAPHTAAAPRQPAPSPTASRKIHRVLLLIASLAVVGLGYLSVGKFILRFGQSDPDIVADVYAWRGEKDKAMDWLERAYKQHDSGLWDIKHDPFLASMRSDPRFRALPGKMNLPE